MRLLTTALLALSTLLSGCADSRMDAPPESASAFKFEADFLPGSPVVPLVIKTRPGSALYRERMWAIKVVEVLADGEPVIAKPSLTMFLAIDTSSRTVESDHYVYMVDINYLLFGDYSPEHGLGALIEYSIPEDVRSLEITYRFVYYDNIPDERVHILKASRRG